MIGSSRLVRNFWPAAILSTSIPSMSRTVNAVPAGIVTAGRGLAAGGGGGGGGGSGENLTPSTSPILYERGTPSGPTNPTCFVSAPRNLPSTVDPERRPARRAAWIDSAGCNA